MEYAELDDLDAISAMIRPGRAPTKGKKRSVVTRNVTVTKPQGEFLATCDLPQGDELKEILFSGGVGAGKSVSIVLAMLKYCMYPNTTVILAHLHLSVLRRTTLPLLIEGTVSATGEPVPPLLPPECIMGFNRTNGEILLHNGSKIILIGVKDSTRIRSINAAAAFLDETTLLDKASYLSLLQRCRVYHPLGNGVYSATNPDLMTHWCYPYFVEQAGPCRKMITVDSRTNAANLPKAYVKSLENLPEGERQRMLEGRWGASGTKVFYAFTPSHVQNLSAWKQGDYDDYLLCVDLGGGAGYSGALLMGRRDGVFYILEEQNQMKPTHKEVLDWLEQYRHLTEVVSSDPANAIFSTDLENGDWKPIKPDKNIEPGLAKLNSMFREGRIVVNTGCRNLILELEACFRNQDTGKWDKTQAKCDLVDALRYGIVVFDDNYTMSKHEQGSVFVFTL